ncbi:MAG: hypothetical protein AAGB14_03655 [Verrucomicrobiota bacterium]
MITISMMVLLALLCVGLLSLSTVALRSSSNASAQSTAQANARLALEMAIGELQKLAGPDQRVTARADILDENVSNPRLTGVWESWEMDPNEPPSQSDYDSTGKDAKFLGWLASIGDPDDAASVDLAEQQVSSPVTLIGEGTLGANAAQEDQVQAEKVMLDDEAGSLAWVVLDEGVKARVNTPHEDDATAYGNRMAQLGSGVRPRTEWIPGLSGLQREDFEIDSTGFGEVSKSISRRNLELAGETLGGEATADAFAELTHDVTPHSLGLFTDTARGGLRRDFQLLANLDELPDELDGRGVYESLLDLSPDNAPSDPRWASLHDFGRFHLEGVRDFRGQTLAAVTAPTDWNPVTTERVVGGQEESVNPAPPEGLVLMPTISKVQMIFSLIGRDLYRQDYYPPGPAPKINRRTKPTIGGLHGPQEGHFRSTRFDYDLHLLYTPVVTIHNPYNVTLEFRDLNIGFHHVPFSMQVFRNGEPQSQGLVPFEEMFADNDTEGRQKIFGLNLKDERRGRPGSSLIRLLPGETRLFSPYIDPELTYEDNFTRGRQFWDIYVNNDSGFSTRNFDAIPGWRGDGIGWDCDWLAGSLAVDGNAENGRWASCFGLDVNDEIHVEFAPRTKETSKNKFLIKMSARIGRRDQVTNAIEIDYESRSGLQDVILGGENTLRFPTEGTVRGADLVDHRTRKIKDIVNVKPFAMLSLQAKTTNGGIDESDIDGRLATKPWSFAHAGLTATSQKVVSEHPANHSHEIDIQVLDLGEGTTRVIGIDQYQRGNFITGHSPDKGSKFGAMWDLPLTPIQTLAGLNGANPGGQSGYLPRFAQPIGNSWAHPALDSNAITQSGVAGRLVDHSFLINTALYDSFYFSGLGDQSGPFGSGATPDQLAERFAAGEPLNDPRLLLYQPGGGTSDAELTELVQDDEGYERVAAWQMMQGAFNVNSTSVAAWKAMLASVHDSQGLLNLVNPASITTSFEDLQPSDEDEARVSRFRMPMVESSNLGEQAQLAYWMGAREYTEEELQRLAEEIVDSVRRRGPFLSMAEFVNRQIGSGDEALKGALQEAIDLADLNTGLGESMGAGYEISADQVADYEYRFPEAGTGPSYQGAPGYLSQADLLNVLGNAATARSDTFTIRAHGEALGAGGQVLASATCEAVVQRLPEWIDPEDLIETRPDDLDSESNKTFGRRFEIVSFRWLNRDEI